MPHLPSCIPSTSRFVNYTERACSGSYNGDFRVASGARRTSYDTLPLITTAEADRALLTVAISRSEAILEFFEFEERCDESAKLAQHLRLGGYEAMASGPALSYVDGDGVEHLRCPAWRHINLLSETSRHERRERGANYAAYLAHQGRDDLLTITVGEWVRVANLAAAFDAFGLRLENADVAARRKKITPELAKIELAAARYENGEAMAYLHAHLSYRTDNAKAWEAFRLYLYARFQRVGVTDDGHDPDATAHYLAKTPVSTKDLLALSPDDAATVACALERRTMWRPKGAFLRFVGQLHRDRRHAIQIDGNWLMVDRRPRGRSLLPPPPPESDRVIGVSPPVRLPGYTTARRYLLVRGYSGDPSRIAYAQAALSIVEGKDSDTPTSTPIHMPKPTLTVIAGYADMTDRIPY